MGRRGRGEGVAVPFEAWSCGAMGSQGGVLRRHISQSSAFFTLHLVQVATHLPGHGLRSNVAESGRVRHGRAAPGGC